MYLMIENVAYDRDSEEILMAGTYHALDHLELYRIDNLLQRGIVEAVPDHLNDLAAAAAFREQLAARLKIALLSELEAYEPKSLLASAMGVTEATVRNWIKRCKDELEGKVDDGTHNDSV